MKKYLTLLLFISFISIGYSQVPPTQAVRNSLLGIYTGTYIDYDTWPEFDTLQSGVKLTALPGDSLGIIFNDTINNIQDTLSAGFIYAIPSFTPDTLIDNECNAFPGDYIPNKDSIFLSYMPDCINPEGEFSLTCILHFFPTSIKEQSPNNLILYPNPAINNLYINLEKNSVCIYEIYSPLGVLIAIGEVISKNYIDISSLNSGIYYIKIKINSKEIVKSFFKSQS